MNAAAPEAAFRPAPDPAELSPSDCDAVLRGKRILVLCPYPEGVAAGQRLKFEQYYDDWRRAGCQVTVSPFMDRRMWDKLYLPGHHATKVAGVLRGHARRMRDMARVGQYDLIFVHMWVTPLGTTTFERMTRRRARALVFDLEDNLLSATPDRQADNPNPILRLIKGPEKARFLTRTADHVITSSPFLADIVRPANARRAATYVSSSVDTDRFQPVNAYNNDETVTIGWTGTFSSRVYLDLLRGIFQELARRVPFKLKVIGNFDYELPGVDLEVVRWTAEREVADLQTLDIGVYPLPIDDWVSGKSGLKAIQYMAFGLPCVATDVGATPMIVRDEENGLLVRSDEEWLHALERLVRDPDLRRRLGQVARRDAVERYSLNAIAGHYRGVLCDAMKARP